MRIAGCGMSVPDRVVTNDDLARTLDTDDAWIVQRTGIRERRIASPSEATSTFAIRAGRAALDDAGLEADDVDLILVATCTPDQPVPGCAPYVQHALGATRAAAMDVNAGCTGFVSALSLACGLRGTVLVIGAETLSRITDATDRRTAVLFGDGAGAVVLLPSDAPRVGPFVLGCDGAKAGWLCVPAGGSAMPADDGTVERRDHTIRMRGQDVYKHAVEKMTEASRQVVGERRPDLVVAHQANARIVEAVAGRLGLDDEQVVVNVDRYGNTSAASIPIALAECVASGRLRPDMRVLLTAFGAGFTWGAGMVLW